VHNTTANPLNPTGTVASDNVRPCTDTSNGTSNVTCNVMRILRLDVTEIIACNARRMVRSDPSAGGFFLEHKGFGLGSQYTFGRLFSVYECVDVCSRTRKAPAMSICLFGMFVMTERIRELVAAFALCSCAVYTIRIILHVTLFVPLHVSVRGLRLGYAGSDYIMLTHHTTAYPSPHETEPCNFEVFNDP
jgi:hypothetical protein